MVSVFKFLNYKEFINTRIEDLPKQGHGEYRRMSQALRVSTTMISQVFRGDKHLSLEMAADLCDYLHLDEGDSQYFLLLVEYEKAGSANLRTKLLRRLKEEQKQSLDLEKSLKVKREELSNEDKSIYYSSWIYSGVRNLCSISDFQDVQAIADRLHLPLFQVAKVIDFLLSRQLLKQEGDRLKVGAAWTHIPAKSLLVNKHHQNWRLQGFQKMIHADDQSLFVTAPMNLSKAVANQIREELPEFIQRITKLVEPSPSEVVRCLNIDYFEY